MISSKGVVMISMKNLPFSIAYPRFQERSYFARLCDTPHITKHLVLRLTLRAINQATEAEQRLLWLGPGIARALILDHPIIAELAGIVNVQRTVLCGLIGERPKQWTTISARPGEIDSIHRHGGRRPSLDAAIYRAREGVWTELCLGILGPERIFSTLTMSDRADKDVAVGWHATMNVPKYQFISSDEIEIQRRCASLSEEVPPVADPVVSAPSRPGIFTGVEHAIVDRDKIELPIVIEDEATWSTAGSNVPMGPSGLFGASPDQ